ncbi:MAG: glycosyltransferase family 4 protein [Alphaproteobacteria bacterium]
MSEQTGRAPIVLQVLPDLDGGGGVERGTIDIARALVQAGWGAVVASNATRLAGRIDALGGRHVRLPLHSKNPFVMAANIRRLKRLIEEAGVDIVHARSRAPAWCAYYAARATRRHFVTTVHGTHGTRVPLKRAYNAIMTRGERVIAISNFIADRIVRHHAVDRSRIRIIPRGVDLDQFTPRAVSADRIVGLSRRWRLEDGAPVVMLPGRLTTWKGHDLLIEAMARVRADACCVMVGNGTDAQSFVETMLGRAAALDLASRVRFVGRCDDMPAAYMLADVVVSASRRPEAFGRVAAEAQAMGVPVVATDHGGARETVLAGLTGWLVPPGDAAAMARAIDEALSLDAEERARRAAAARAHVEANFSLRAMCERTLAVYREVLEGGPGG